MKEVSDGINEFNDGLKWSKRFVQSTLHCPCGLETLLGISINFHDSKLRDMTHGIKEVNQSKLPQRLLVWSLLDIIDSYDSKLHD